MSKKRPGIPLRHILYFMPALWGIFGMIFGAGFAHAGLPSSALSDAVKKKIGIGKEISLSGWAWNSAMGWVSQRGAVGEGGAYGIIKNTTGGVTGWSWSPNYGWVCWGKTCTAKELDDIILYGNKKPRVGSPAQEVDPDVAIEVTEIHVPVFGDGNVTGTEQCDHGEANGTSDDSCGADGKGILPVAPVQALCKNGIKESGEICDDGDTNDVNECKNDCSGGIQNVCGNAILESKEECDDGDKDTLHGCANDCTVDGKTLYAFPVSGWIKAIGLKDDGWISLRGSVECGGCADEGEKYGVMYDPSHKEFRGWAWSPTFGWTVFSGRTLYDTPYRYARVILPDDSSQDGKFYDVIEYQPGNFRIQIVKKDTREREYLLRKDDSGYVIQSVSEFKRNDDGTIDLDTVQAIDKALWGTVEVFDAAACQAGCDVSYSVATEKSIWKTQLSTPWIQTMGGSIFSRKGFGGAGGAPAPSTEYLLYSGGITLEKDLREGERFEFVCCTDSKVIITKVGVSQTIANVSYTDLSDGKELKIFKKSGKIKKKSGQNASDTSLDLHTAFSGLLEGEERRLKKNNADVLVRVVYPLYASLKKEDVGMSDDETVAIIKEHDGGLKKDDGGELSAALKTVLSSEKRIIGALTHWTSECDDSSKTCSKVGRKSGSDIKKADALNRDMRPDITFPHKHTNVLRNTLGSLNIDMLIKPPDPAQPKNVYGYKVVSLSDEQGILDGITAGLNNTVFVKNGDLSIGGTDVALRGKLVFKNGITSGRGTIIVNGGNLTIYRPLLYEQGSISDIKKLASVAWIVLEKEGKGGNIIFDNCIPPVSLTVKKNSLSITQAVAPVAGIFFAEGTISTGTGDGNECHFTDGDLSLYGDGIFIARKFNFERIASGDPDLNLASEFIQDTGRAIINTPPGLEDILKSLPTW